VQALDQTYFFEHLRASKRYLFFHPEQCDWWLERWDREDDAELLKKYPVPEILKAKLD